MPALNQLANASYDGRHSYADLVHFVHLYVIEPHPERPDPSPYLGVPWDGPYSEKRQPHTYGERLQNAAFIPSLLEGNQMLLIDELAPRRDNPGWCTYGPCPNCAFLIGRDGIVRAAQTWFDGEAMKRSLDTLLGR